MLAAAAAFRPPLVGVLDPEFARTIPELPPTAVGATQKVLQLCMEDGWTRRPPSIIRFLGLLPLDSTAERLIAKLKVPPPPTADLDFSHVLSTSQPFLDRQALRNRLRLLTSQDAPKPILIVTGEKRSGKSYTAEYVDDFCLRRPQIQVSRQKVFSGGSPTAAELALDIVATLGRPADNFPVQNTNADRWPLELANWALVEANLTSENWWFVFDGFDNPNVPKDTRAFINFMVDRITNGVYRRKFRVVLLGYERGSLTASPGKIDVDSTGPLADDHIRACVEEIWRRNGDGQPAKSLVDGAVAAILEGLPEDDGRNEEINRRLCDLIETVQAVTPV